MMMATKFTAGPWHLEETKMSPSIHGGERWVGAIVGADNNRIVADLPDYRYHGEDVEIDTANARLIAAAPELYEALERTLSWMTSYPGGGTMGPEGPYEQARAALAKATQS